jgi:ionotropic glutamate receptor
LLTNHYKKGQQKAGINMDDQSQYRHGQQEENERIQEEDQNNKDNEGSNDIENQATIISMPHSPNTNTDQLHKITRQQHPPIMVHKSLIGETELA